MSMYLPNPDLHPTGSEPGEFIEEYDPWTPTADSPVLDSPAPPTSPPTDCKESQ